MLYDVFICHASEDKNQFVRPLANHLRKFHVEVWYDEFSLKIGDSLRESIDKGLSKSRYGIVVLSPSFFNKKWTQRELNGLTAREMAGEDQVILPIWHNINIQDILKYSPPLADKKAIDSKKGINYVCNEILRKIRPIESPLIVAQNELINYGLNPPVVTDEWWLDAVEASKKIPCWGFAPPDDSSWGRWTFPLPNFQEHGEARGIRLAWTAMQMQWEREADDQRITQITRPDLVFDFIKAQPGLSEICHEYPEILANYAPQLTIPEFSDEFGIDFDDVVKNSNYQEEMALRLPNFGGYPASEIACNFVQGQLGGPEPKYFETFEYLIWFLTSDSNWLPERIHNFLLVGMRDWIVWPSYENSKDSSNDDFLDQLWKVENFNDFKLTKKAKISLLNWIEHSLCILRVNDDPNRILAKFLSYGFIEGYYNKRSKRLRKIN
jgi:hypothetical protein